VTVDRAVGMGCGQGGGGATGSWWRRTTDGWRRIRVSLKGNHYIYGHGHAGGAARVAGRRALLLGVQVLGRKSK
jgi:hypothetical protein